MFGFTLFERNFDGLGADRRACGLCDLNLSFA